MQIKVTEVSYSYYAGTPMENEALSKISLTLDGSKTIAIVGKTGSGKSTFVQLLNGLLEPAGGSIEVGGSRIEYGKRATPLYDRVGMVFQLPEHQLFEDTVLKDVSFGPRNLGLPPEEAKERALDAMNRVGLDGSYCDRSPFDLSEGEKRRVAIAGVLAMNPDVLILDEPTVGLDVQGKQMLMDWLHDWRQRKERTLIIVSHDMELVAEYAEEVVVFDRGEVQLQTDPLTLFTKHRGRLSNWGLKAPKAIDLFHAVNERLGRPMTLRSAKKEPILRQIAEYVRGRES